MINKHYYYDMMIYTHIYVYTFFKCTSITHRTAPQHFILQKIALLILPKSEPGQLQYNQTTAWKIEKEDGYYLRYTKQRGNAHTAWSQTHHRMINQVLKLVYFK